MLRQYIMRAKIFQKAALAIGITFFSLLILVTFLAYSRQSRSTGLDPAKIHQMRLTNQLNIEKESNL
jgi:hypothetical protein